VVFRHRDVARHHRYAVHGYLHEAAGPGATLHLNGWGGLLARRMRSLTSALVGCKVYAVCRRLHGPGRSRAIQRRRRFGSPVDSEAR
jgi:hypothetical protein